jgi:hypothetical protein
MSLRPRVQISIDEAHQRLTIRYIGELDGEALYTSLLAQFRSMSAPWSYDLVIDVTRYHGVILYTDTEMMGREWEALAQGRDKGRLMAVISRDPLIVARKPLRERTFPNFISEVFATCEEAYAWIDAHHGRPGQVCA